MNVKNIVLPTSVAAISVRLRRSIASLRADSPPERAGASGSGGSERRITIVEDSGSSASAARATRHPATAVTRATATRPIRPPATSDVT